MASPDDPQFDVAWVDGGQLYVCEVKSMTASNEEQQLRLGLGQVLRYRQLIETRGRHVTAVLAGERHPNDRTWDDVCRQHGVILVWPEVLAARLFASST